MYVQNYMSCENISEVLKFVLSVFRSIFSQCQSNSYFFSNVHMMSMGLDELYSCQERSLILLKTLSG